MSRLISEDIRHGPATRDFGGYQTFQPSRPIASRTLQSSPYGAQTSQRLTQLSPNSQFVTSAPSKLFEPKSSSGQTAKRILATNVYSIPNDSPPMISTAPKTHSILNAQPMTRAVRILQPSLVAAPVHVAPVHYTSPEPVSTVRTFETRIAAPLRSSFSFADRPVTPLQSSSRLLRASPLRSSSLSPAIESAPQLRRISPLRPVTKTVIYPPASGYYSSS